MNNSGIVRKIDELGRIVIPKEIRNTLNIKNGESIEIKVINDEISLKKYYKMNSDIDNIKKQLKIFDSLLDSTLIITDREKIIATTSKYENMIGTKVSSEFTKIIEERKQSIEKNIVKIKLFEDIIIEGSYIIMPIIIDADLIGAIFCYKQSQVKDTDLLSVNILNYLFKLNYVM